MNSVTFGLYNLISPQGKNIPSIADYIIKNGIRKLPATLKDNQYLFNTLVNKKYVNLFEMNFDSSVYEKCNMQELVDLFSLLEITITDQRFPAVLRENPAFFNEVLSRDSEDLFRRISSVFGEILGSKVYPLLDKSIIAKAFDTIHPPENKGSFECIEKDKDLLEIAIDKGYKLLPLIYFDDAVIEDIGYDRIIKYIASKKLYGSIPVPIIKDKELLLQLCKAGDYELVSSVLSNYSVPDENKFYLMTQLDYINQHFFRDDQVEAFADYIIKHDIKELPNNLPARQVFSALLDKEYKYLFDIYREFDPYLPGADKNKKIFDLFVSTNYIGKLSDTLQYIIFEDPRALEHIPQIGDCIISSNLTHFVASPSRILAKSKELFTYLYEKEYQNLLAMDFDESVYEGFDIEKLRVFYQKHPVKTSELLPLEVQYGIRSIDIEKIEYSQVKYIILYQSRYVAAYQIEKYNGLSQSICSFLKRYGVQAVYDYRYFANILNDLVHITGMDEYELRQLFTNYKNNPSGYEEEIINLFRRFISMKKEAISKEIYSYSMKDIFNKYTKVDVEHYHKKIRLEKQKDLFLRYLHAVVLSGGKGEESFLRYVHRFFGSDSVESSLDYVDTVLRANAGKYDVKKEEILQLINKLGLSNVGKNEFDLICKIMDGKEEIFPKPSSYYKKDNQKEFNRLKNSYEKILSELLMANSEYSEKIIQFIRGNLKHEELKKLIDPKTLKVLNDIRVVFEKADATLELTVNGVIFSPNYSISDKEQEEIATYDRVMTGINKLRKMLNREMNETFPLSAIPVDRYDEDIYKTEIKDKRYYLDPRKITKYEPIVKIFDLRAKYKDPNTLKIFDELFIQSGIVYGLPFVSNEIADKIIEVASQMEYIIKTFKPEDIKLDNLDAMARRANLHIYESPLSSSILGDEVTSLIAYGDTFINDSSVEGRRRRIDVATKYISLASKNVKSTIPYTRVETDGYIAERYNSDDPQILTAGIRTDACFRVFGNDNDFLLYTLFNKNGIVVKVTDKDGKFIGRMSGFRNGNIVYFNQLRTIYDTHGSPNLNVMTNIKMVRECAEKYAQSLITSTANSETPIEHVVILKAYGYSDCDDLKVVDRSLISPTPMSREFEDFKEFEDNPELLLRDKDRRAGDYYFTTDYPGYGVLIMASAPNKVLEKEADKKEYDPKPIYDRPRKEVKIYKKGKIDSSVISAINAINARYVFWGDQATRQEKIDTFTPIEDGDNIVYAVIGEDFYITIDNLGNISELCLQYDKRAKEEFEKYKAIISQDYERTNGFSR